MNILDTISKALQISLFTVKADEDGNEKVQRSTKSKKAVNSVEVDGELGVDLKDNQNQNGKGEADANDDVEVIQPNVQVISAFEIFERSDQGPDEDHPNSI